MRLNHRFNWCTSVFVYIDVLCTSICILKISVLYFGLCVLKILLCVFWRADPLRLLHFENRLLTSAWFRGANGLTRRIFNRPFCRMIEIFLLFLDMFLFSCVVADFPARNHFYCAGTGVGIWYRMLSLKYLNCII